MLMLKCTPTPSTALLRRLTSERAAIARQLNDLMVENGGMIPLVHRGRLSAHANSLGGIDLNVWDSELWNIADWYRTGDNR
mgnify:CR=1 FL=1